MEIRTLSVGRAEEKRGCAQALRPAALGAAGAVGQWDGAGGEWQGREALLWGVFLWEREWSSGPGGSQREWGRDRAMLNVLGSCEELELLSLRGMEALRQDGCSLFRVFTYLDNLISSWRTMCLILFLISLPSSLSGLQNTVLPHRHPIAFSPTEGWVPLNTSPLTWTFFLHDIFLLFWWSKV